MTSPKNGAWIAKEELTRQPDTEWRAVPWEDSYGLELYGLAKRGASPVFMNPGGHKVSLWRTRKRFLRELRRVIEEASAMQQNLDRLISIRPLGDTFPSGECKRVE